ncbi:uncharacterized protein N7484_004805 [Penicillium longicatenatum]|uniref:uncharacterized protein n=1 Tax=Penicillium longicatenatum TaxID=1561947 RepID=UPI00254732BB|nr:uncharacterized protein N7484_004805 [Penicillium longicatenatum]KAJ5651082.1 hypothetical protein N7484_004805 [Penicillium longicatenatum]
MGQVFLEAISWFFRNVNFNIDVAGPRGGITPAMGTRSSVDVMKLVGLDSSKEGRIRYASQHGIGGQPFSAPWGEAIRKHVLQNHGR